MLILFALLALLACQQNNNQSQEPKSLTNLALQALIEQRYDDFLCLTTETDSIKLALCKQALSRQALNISQAQATHIEYLNDSLCYVFYTITQQDGDTIASCYKLTKQHNEWKIVLAD